MEMNETSRRDFVRLLCVAGIASQLPWMQSCSDSTQNIPIPDHHAPFSKTSFLNLYLVLSILFPEEENAPGATTVRSDLYIIWAINKGGLEQERIDFLLDGLQLFERKTKQKLGVDFHKLSATDQADFIVEYAKTEKGKDWLSYLISLIFEALLLDPIYTNQQEQLGWKWLKHNPGNPRPSQTNNYANLLLKKHEI